MEIYVWKGDITSIQADAVVNAANSSLMGGGGVDGAIHRVGGPKIAEECRILKLKRYPNGLPTGQCTLTSGGQLPAKYVIHAVGPVWKGGEFGEASLLESCYRNILQLAQERAFESIAVPSISTGIFAYPKELATPIAIQTVLDHKDQFPRKLALICFDKDTKDLYEKTLKELGVNFKEGIQSF
ncbi:O-acetyl-ADP-ribose deacetylase [Leptospira langatensis]|uniref:O-acetyl-ADP-ribose deacetylase n=1 Tax=Leptospira langatensis TaxID=2484983 RepID=A0A5F1ZT92_9LEPT|nr:O-acetyl-ADP-ribose deacetylase [Leptospira langatensis]TGK00287.1 O-acetyl-ADP-ribose deacetylase [Leptospira langatensis]TGL41077.1 O-acetyl-ADP-ribose deacetylase [Leptospira langatensis]